VTDSGQEPVFWPAQRYPSVVGRETQLERGSAGELHHMRTTVLSWAYPGTQASSVCVQCVRPVYCVCGCVYCVCVYSVCVCVYVHQVPAGDQVANVWDCRNSLRRV
jgi:hypothetical protein